MFSARRPSTASPLRARVSDVDSGRAVQNHRRRAELRRPRARDGKALPKEPLFWLKATTSLIPDGGKIEIPFRDHRTDYEAELAIVIGRKIRNVSPTQAPRYIFGYTTAQDISDRTIQNSESQWARCKSFDTFTPLGPFVETKIDPNELTIQLFQNGQLRQNSNTKQLIFKPHELVSFISTNMTLLPGDVILTGTPSGIGPIQSGGDKDSRRWKCGFNVRDPF
jgi:2-keto-4-pentenoate hydratase/2-oxohepta-3-ene-1,7-dioic acid hydratase in catechol pathway